MDTLKAFTTLSLTEEDAQSLCAKNNHADIIIIDDSYALLTREKNGNYSLIWIANYFEIQELVTDVQKEKTTIKIQFRNIQYSIAPDSFYVSNLPVLSKLGILIAPNKKLIDIFSTYLLHKLSSANHVNRIEQAGYIQINEEWKYIGYKTKKNFHSYFGIKTNYTSTDNYIYDLNEITQNSLGMQLAIIAGCSGIALAYFNSVLCMDLQTFIISIVGSTSSGKSTFLKTAVSMMDIPSTTGKLYRSFNSTNKAMVQQLANMNGVCMALDEATLNQQNYTELLYSICEEQTRGRCTQNGDLQKLSTWKACVCTSSEYSLLESCDKHANGLRARVLEFDDLEITLSSEHADKVTAFVNKNYGILGFLFSEELLALDADILKKKYNSNYIAMQSVYKNKCDVSDRITKTYALLLTTADILISSFEVNIDFSMLQILFDGHHKKMCADLNLAETIYLSIMEYVATAVSEYGIIEDQKKGEIFIMENTFEKIMKKCGFNNLKAVIKQLDEAEYFIRQEQNRVKSRRIIGGKRINGYTFRLYNDALDIPDNTVIFDSHDDEEVDF